MKKFLIAASALTAAFAATAGVASADPYDGHRGYDNDYRTAAYQGVNINQRERDIAFRIDQGQRNGGLTFREARMLREDLRDVERLEARYRRDGMSRWEASDLDRRLDALSQRVRFNRHDDDRRGRW
ncbi:MAG TPA: hypothetical protein VG735_06650 [Caulobacterales bacterium]|nr:hypothetical protein [Caulobacterales bacterium]